MQNSTATKAKYDEAFTVTVLHDYKHEWEEVDKDYVAKANEVIGFNLNGKKARRTQNTDSDRSWVEFHPSSLQDIHDDRHKVRVVRAEHVAECNGKCDEPGMHRPFAKKSELAIILQHIQDGVIPELTDNEAITTFECEKYPEIATFLNTAYGVGETE